MMDAQALHLGLFSKFGLTPESNSFAELNEKIALAIPPIDFGFQLIKPIPGGPVVTFRPSHVEILLDQAADLLDRAIKTRSEWQALAVQEANLDIELSQFLQLDEVQKQAETGPDSIFQVPANESSAAVKANTDSLANLREAVKALQTILTSNFDNPTKPTANIDRGQLAAELAHMSVMGVPKADESISRFEKPAQPLTRYAAEDARSLELMRIISEQHSIISQVKSIEAQIAAMQAAVPSLQSRSNFDTANIAFQTKRTQIQRDIVALKVAIKDQAGGAFNFREQRKVLEERFKNDFDNALRRVPAIKDGLRLYYGFEPELPASVGLILATPPAPSANSFDDLLLWIRDAISFVVSFSQSEQSYVLRISLRELMTEKVFKKGLSKCELEFDIPSEIYFADKRHVRLRGVACLVVGAAAIGSWRGSISPPPSAIYQTNLLATNELDQSGLVCQLGRIANVESYQAPDTVGAVTFRNASPIGSPDKPNSKWRLTLSGKSTEGVDIRSVDDVNLDLAIVATQQN